MSIYFSVRAKDGLKWHGRSESEKRYMKINANIPAFITNKQLLRIEGNMATSMERLSSGLKLNHAKDNPAGMAISNKMRAQIAGLDRASNNASDAIAAIRIADGALNETSSIMQRMRELAVQAANDTNSLQDREAIQAEIDALKEEVNRISRDTEYNEMPILDGTKSARVYADHVSRISTTDAVKAGIYKMEVTEVAEPASINGTRCGFDFSQYDNVTEIGREGSLSINGVVIDIEATDTHAMVYEKLQRGAEEAGVDIRLDTSSPYGQYSCSLHLETEESGKEQAIELSFSDRNFANYLGFDDLREENGVYTYYEPGETKLPSGKDPVVELNTNPDESMFSESASVIVEGNRVTVSDKGGFEMSFLLEKNYLGPLEFEVTDIGTMSVHIGANENQNMVISVQGVSSTDLYIDNIDVTKKGGPDKALAQLDEAIAKVSSIRSTLGAYENRLDYSVTSLDAFEENMTEAQSRLADTDMAQEMTTYTQQNVLNQAAISVLTQANDMPQQVLQLLQ